MTEKGLMVPNEDYVVVPLAVRDRIMGRLKSTEEQASMLIAELYKTQESLIWAWVEIKRLRQYEPQERSLAR